VEGCLERIGEDATTGRTETTGTSSYTDPYSGSSGDSPCSSSSTAARSAPSARILRVSEARGVPRGVGETGVCESTQLRKGRGALRSEPRGTQRVS
jgi:hypothetical protein